MNTSMKKAISLVTCTALAAGCCTMAFAADSPVTKDENVFLFLNPDGSIQSQVVSDWLHSDNGLRGVTDRTSLTDITNLKSDAAYTLNGDALTWDTDDHDVYYQGNSTQTPPVTASIRYELNGQEMTAAEMLGKAGHVKITVKLTNHLKKTYQIGGAARSVYTPFATVVSMALGADDFTNVKAEHGTVQTDSQTQLVAFVTLPGMQETFKGLLTGDLSDLNDKLLDEVTLEADTDAFVMPTILLAASSSVEDLRDTVDDIPSLDETLNEVRDGMDDLKDGSAELDDGAHDLHDGAKELDDGASDLKDGAKDLDDGAKELNDKMGEFSAKYTEFDAGVSGAKSGTETLYAGLAKMKGQMDERMLPGLARAAQLQADLEGQMGDIQGVLGSIPETSQLKAAQDTVTQAVTDAATNAASTAGQAVADAAANTAAQTSQAYAEAIGELLENEELGFSEEQKAAVQAALAGVAEGLQSEANQEAVAAAAQAAGEKTAAQVAAQGKTIQEALAPVAGLDTTAMKQQVGQVSTTANELMGLMNDLTTSLYNGENPLDDETIYGGTSQLAAGAQQLVGGAATLSGYSGQFKEAIGQFKSGTGDLADGTGKLLDGTGDLKDGTQKLLDGVDEFRDKIEEKAGDVDTKQIDDALDTLDALQTEAESYTTYTGTPDGVEASIKFVMKVEEPEAPAAETSETETTAQQTEKPSFWQRLKQLFGLG